MSIVRTQSDLAQGVDRQVCHCFGVSEAVIRESIDVLGATTVQDVTRQTCAGAGCTACHCRIRRMLAGESATCSPFTVCTECGFYSTLCECKVA